MLESYLETQEAIIETLKHCKVTAVLKNIQGTDKREKIQYIEAPAAFDIETTSYFRFQGKLLNQVEIMSLTEHERNRVDKYATMYHWQFASNFQCYIGRTWKEFIEFMEALSIGLKLNHSKRLVVYIHNLAYEFQFMRKYFDCETVFPMDKRTPLYVVTSLGIEFRCSSLLSGCKLADLGTTQFAKHLGELDYTKIRHSSTPLTSEELDYCLADVLTLNEYIQKCMKLNENTITYVPYTKTGYVRRTVRKNCYTKENKSEYTKLMKSLRVSPYEFTMLRECFQGGFTHSNPYHYNETCCNVSSIDFTSSYPTVMLADYFPMSSGTRVTVTSDEQFQRYLSNYCCMFTVELVGLYAKVLFENIISESKCIELDNPTISNGRVVAADRLVITVTELDFQSICEFYEFDSEKSGVLDNSFYIYRRGKLPKPIAECVLNFYEKKTTLKGVVGAEDEYARNKSDLNSIFGMCVMNPIREKIEYENDWVSEIEVFEALLKKEEERIGRELTESERSDFKTRKEGDEIIEGIEKENASRGRFLFYPWGVWITAHARRRLLKQILEVGLFGADPNTDYIYADTDSIKIINLDKVFDATAQLEQCPPWLIDKYNDAIITDETITFKNYTHRIMVERYNDDITKELVEAMRYYGFDENKARPKNNKGQEKPLGVWDVEHTDMRFKTLGAKRYMCQMSDGKIQTTIAGVGKDSTAAWITQLAKDTGKDPFTFFNNKMRVPWQHTSKLIHLYVDEPYTDTITDYLGNTAEVHEESYIVLMPTEYNLKADEYEKFIQLITQ